MKRSMPILVFAVSIALMPLSGCVSIEDRIGAACGSTPAQKRMKINVRTSNPDELEADPPTICWTSDQTIEIQLQGGPRKGTVSTYPKDINNPDHVWLFGSNTERRNRIFLVAYDGLPDGEYDFNVRWLNKDLLDPRVTIRSDGVR